MQGGEGAGRKGGGRDGEGRGKVRKKVEEGPREGGSGSKLRA